MCPITPLKDRNIHETICFNKTETNTLQDLIQTLRRIFSSENVDIDEVKELMSSYQTNPKEWKHYAKFDEHRYTRQLVDEGNGKFNLLILCWSGGQGSAVHDHAQAHCVMKILQGSLTEVRYAWPQNQSEGLHEISKTTLNTDDIGYMNDSIGLHRVENPSETLGAVSLHLYSPPFSTCSLFDQKTGQRSNCQVTFHQNVDSNNV